MISTPADKFGENYSKINETEPTPRNLSDSSDNQKVIQLDYIFDMLKELRKIAKDTGEESLVYYIEMAAMESGELCEVQRFRQETSLAE